MVFTKEFWKERREELIKKLSISHLGNRLSDMTKKKLSDSHKGQKAWNKELKGYTNTSSYKKE